MADDVLEQVRRLALSEGLTEGGVMKAISEAANMMKREDREFNLRKQQFDRQAQSQDIALWSQALGGLFDLGVFGKEAHTKYEMDVDTDPEGKKHNYYKPVNVPAQANLFQWFTNMMGWQKPGANLENIPLIGGGSFGK